MRCIFCLEERPPTGEHVIPLAVGGLLTTDRVCGGCNSYLGAKVDPALTDHFLVAVRRDELRLPGNSGHVPSGLAFMVRYGLTLVDRPELRVKGMVDRKTGRLRVQVLHTPTQVARPDGTVEQVITIDAKDVGQISKIIQRERERAGLPPLPPDELAHRAQAAAQNVQTIETPTVKGGLGISLAEAWKPFLKIAYELAFLWLGEGYLDDELGSHLRRVVMGKAERGGRVQVVDGLSAEHPVFGRFWPNDAGCHIALSAADHERVVISIKVFDLCAVVLVSNNANLYGATQDNARFLHIDPAKRTMRETLLVGELQRICVELSEGARGVRPSPMGRGQRPEEAS